MTMKRFMLAALLVTTFAIPARAQVRIDIGINLPGPPTLIAVPGLPVYYAPHAPANVFLYGTPYWVFANGGWYIGPTWSGPWAVAAPGYVPAPILRIPVRYYPVPPAHWHGWRREGPPQWEVRYGREWREEAHERNWREREEHWNRGPGRGCPPGLARQGRC
jgi:hypothetical protein